MNSITNRSSYYNFTNLQIVSNTKLITCIAMILKMINHYKFIMNPQWALNKSNQVPLTAISCSFHSFFKVLFTVPSQYLYAIGVSSIFSFRIQLNPMLELHSQTTRLIEVYFFKRTGLQLPEFHCLCIRSIPFTHLWKPLIRSK